MGILKNRILVFLLILLVQACDQPRYNIDYGIIPREVTNLYEVNSHYDDYNSAGPLYFITDEFTLVFSSNRNSNGANFDLVSYQCVFDINQVDNSFELWSEPMEYPLIDSMNSPFNEWGPYLTYDILDYNYYGGTPPNTVRIFFSSDRDGDQDIYHSYYSPGAEPIPGALPEGLSKLNTDFEEGYFCLHPGAAPGVEIGYFTSDREGTFDIFKATGEANRQIETSDTLQITKLEISSSESDDKCPYIVNNMMVFTSNREGGQGGFDLWYSVYEDGTWSAPENFGPDINTEYDEYRPVIIPLNPDQFLNDILIFSSNRPTGKGGFDLYYTGMDKRLSMSASRIAK